MEKHTMEVKRTGGELAILDQTGHTKSTWDPNNKDEVDAARETFDKLRKKGYLAYKVDADGERGEQIHNFDPTAGKIILSPPLRGG